MEQDILLKSLHGDEAEFNYNVIDSIYRDYLYQKNKGWSNFTHIILYSFHRLQSYAEVVIAEHNIPPTYQQAVEGYEKGGKEMSEISRHQNEGSFSESVLIDILENEKYHVRIINKVFLAVVGLIHLQETFLRDFLWQQIFEDSFWQYLYNEDKINKEIYKEKIINNTNQEINKRFLLKKLSSSHRIGFRAMLKFIDRKKYQIDGRLFYDLILECNDFCNYLKHQSNEAEDKESNNRIFYPVSKDRSGSFCAEFFSLEVFFCYIKAFEDFWMYIFENSVKPEDRDEYTDTMIREHIKRFIERNKKFPWHQE